ncbi:MAG: PAS domain S-box protein, partial [Oscillochloris sp.]|nr:PAS domain S-box protein [Oscillochloris sp.]
NLSPERRIGYFQELADGSYKVAAELRKMIVFAPQSVISDPPFTRMDLVCCRNLLIYLRPPLQDKVVAAIHFALRSDGFLFLGLSEGLGRLASEFVALDLRLKIFRKASDLKLTLDIAPRELAAAAATDPSAPLTIARPLVGVERQLLYDYDRLLERYMPTGVLLDAQRRPLHYFGAVARYMQQPHGRAEADFLRIVDSTLGLAISNGIQRAALANQPVTMHGIHVPTADGERYVDITFERLGDIRAQGAHTIITFTEIDLRPAPLEPPDVAAPPAVAPFDVKSEWRQRIDDLEHELSYTRENLQATIEELQTSNEEIQATNEELLAANEELQSLNEGLQSLNEELQSVNAEFELKNSELKELNHDYDDLIRSTRVAILSLDRELRIRRYSPSIGAFFDLQPFDLGRPLSSIAYKLDGHATLIGDLRQILAGGDQVERQVSTPDGRWFQLRVRPIVNEQQACVGVVLMYIDISELRQAQALAMRSEQRLRGAIESSLDAFYLFESVRNVRGEIVDFRAVEMNHVAAERFGTQREAMLGRRISEVLPSPTLDDEIIGPYRQVVESGVPLTRDRLTEMVRESRWFRQQIVRVGDGVALTSADITEQKRYEAELEAQRLRLELALDGGSLGTWESNLRTGKLSSDQRTLIIFGIGPDKVDNSREAWRARIHPDDLPRVDAALEAHLANRTPAFESEIQFRHSDGSWRWLLTRGRIVERDAAGAPVRLAGTYMDITERVQTVERLRESERRYQTLSETSPVGIYRADTQGNWTYINPRWCEIVGVSADAALGEGWQRSLHPDDAEIVAQYWSKVISARRESQLEFRYLRPEGETCWVLAQVAPEIDEHDQLTGYVGTVIDISRRIAAEERLRQQSAQLAAANEDLARAAR